MLFFVFAVRRVVCGYAVNNAAFNAVKEKGVELDAIVSAAGIYELDSLVEISEEDFIRVFDVNVFSIYRVNKAFLPLLKQNGKIIMISSELGPLDPLPFTGLYAIRLFWCALAQSTQG